MAEILSIKINSDKATKQEIIYLNQTTNFSHLSGFLNNAYNAETGESDFIQEKRLRRLSIGSTVLLRYENISYCVSQGLKKKSKCILNDISGKINVGELIAILGPSGSGKTSLMNILSGYKNIGSNRNESITGKILINGKERNAKQFRNISSYVMQDDYLLPHFTVLETMFIAANLKLSEKILKDEKKRVIDEILENLGLLDCQNTKILNISGGERKRLCIGLELIRDPFILFLDEPTSGLDSASCHQCVSLLKSLSCTGRTIICTIHQPSSKILEYFDKLIILAEGQCVYEGINSGLMPFLSSMNFHCPTYYNPADFVLNIVSVHQGRNVPTLVNAVKSGGLDTYDGNKMLANGLSLDIIKADEIFFKGYQEKENRNEFGAGNWTQFKILFTRAFLSTIRDKWSLKIRLIFHLLTGILLGLIYFDIGNKANKVIYNTVELHFSQVFLMISCAMSVIIQFPIERKIILREQINTWYNLRNYYFAKTTADIPFQIICTMIFSTILYWMSSQPNEAFRYLYFIAFSVLTTLTSVSYGMMLGAGTSIEVAVALGIFFAIPIVGFSGLFIRFSLMPSGLRWLASTSYIGYAFEGILIVIYGFNRGKFECPSDFCIFPSPKILLGEIGITNTEIYIDFLGLIAIFLVFRILTFFILRWKLKV